MPKWTLELDAIVLHSIFEECSISFSKALCEKIAKRVTDAGHECTYTSVENRLYSWKKKNLSTANTTSTPNKSTSTPNSKDKSFTPINNGESPSTTPSKPGKTAKPKTPRPRAGAKKNTGEERGVKRGQNDMMDETEVNGESTSEEEDQKRVKIEHVEDELYGDEELGRFEGET